MTVTLLRGNALQLPLADDSVDLVVTSPPYFGLRSYTDGGEHYAGQIGSEATPGEFLDALLAATAEMRRVLKPSGSIFVNLGDKYNSASHWALSDGLTGNAFKDGRRGTAVPGVPTKSLMLIPERYRIRCVDELGLIARAVVIWSKPNGLPESVTDRVRRSHEDWVHLTKEPRYYAAIDEIREGYAPGTAARYASGYRANGRAAAGQQSTPSIPLGVDDLTTNPLGNLPGSVWTIPTQPLTVPAEVGVDHFACVDTDTEILTRRGWLRHNEVRAGDECAGLDLDIGLARWTTVHAVHSYPFDGELVAVEKRDLSMRLTGNHRALAQRRTGRHGHRGPLGVFRADELTPDHFIPRAADWIESPAEKSIGVDLAALCGWVAAEGWVNARRVMLSQSLDANPAKVAEIDALVRRLGGPPYVARQRTYRGRPWTDCSWSLPRDLSAELLRLMPGKRLTWDVLALPEVERRALLAAFIGGDGHVRPDGRGAIYQQKTNTVTVDVLQAIAVTLGYKTTRGDDCDRWVLYLTAGGRSVTLRGTGGTRRPVGRERYVGTVWCPTTGTGTFVARRNGRVFITGNSFPMEWPRRLILGWSPPGICTQCGEGRRPASTSTPEQVRAPYNGRAARADAGDENTRGFNDKSRGIFANRVTITGYACACTPYTDHPGEDRGSWAQGRGASDGKRNHPERAPDGTRPLGPKPSTREYHFDRWTPAPTRPAVVLDVFGGTGTTALVADALGRHGISVDMSGDYCRLARWRTTDPGERAKAMQVPKPPPPPPGINRGDDLLALLDGEGA